MGLICFDLDGTLVDPLLGMERCVRKLCEEFGVPAPDQATVAAWIGFGIREGLAGIPGLQDPEILERALDRWGELYEQQGLYEHEVYVGVHLLLARLKRQGHRCYFPYPVSRAERSPMSTLPLLFMSALGYEGVEDASWAVVLP